MKSPRTHLRLLTVLALVCALATVSAAEKSQSYERSIKEQLRAAKAPLTGEAVIEYSFLGQEQGWLKMNGWAGDSYAYRFADVEKLLSPPKAGDTLPLATFPNTPSATGANWEKASHGTVYYLWPYEAGLSDAINFSPLKIDVPNAAYLPLPTWEEGMLGSFSARAWLDAA